MPTDKEPISYEDDLAADAMAAFKEVSEKAAAVEAPAEKPVEAAAVETPAETPANEPEKAVGERERNPDGTFKAKSEKPAESPEKPVEAAPAEKAVGAANVEKPAERPANEQPATIGGPPPSWSIKAKASWDQLPEAIRAEITKRESEVSQGFGALKDYKELRPFAERAQREGTTLHKALDYYVRMDDTLRKDFPYGLATIVQNAGYTQQQAAQLFAKMAEQWGAPQKPAGQSNGQGQANGADDPVRSLFAPMIEPLMKEVQGLRSEFGNRLQADRNAQQAAQAATVQKAIEAFQANPANRFYAEVENDIAFLLHNGRVPKTGDYAADLKAAYDLAVRMNPEIQQALIEQRLEGERAAQRKKEQEAAEKAKAASRSVTGNRTPGMTIKEVRAPNSHDDVEADVRAAYRASMGA